MLRTLGVVLLMALAAGLAGVAYNVGVNVGLSTAVQQAVQDGQQVVLPYGYGPHWHGGIGFFGIFFWIVGFFLLIGLIRAAFGFSRGGRGGHGGWGKWDRSMGAGAGAGADAERIAEWHRELHRRDESGSAGGGARSATAG